MVFTSFQQNDETIDEYIVRLQTKADRCEFGTNKDERLPEQIIKGLKCSDERRNLISKPNLTLEIAIESIRAYEATTKNNTRYKDASETKAGVYHEIEMRMAKPCTRCGRNHGKRKEDCYAFNNECKRCHGLQYIISKTTASQKCIYDKIVNIVQTETWKQKSKSTQQTQKAKYCKEKGECYL